MNIAIQISGLPYWNKAIVQAQFSQLRLPAGSRVDVFIGLWRTEGYRHDAIPDEAQAIFGQSASLFALWDFEPNIPPQATTAPEDITPESVYRMYRAIDFANEMRVTHEQTHNRQYDVVIRTRPDLLVTRPIEIARYAKLLNSCLILPFNSRWPEGFNDQFAIGSPADMNYYSALYDKLNAYVLGGAALHSEYMLQRHLDEGGITTVRGDFSTELCDSRATALEYA